MDEFWKDITTLSPSHQPTTAAADDASHITILQEFLALPMDGGGPPQDGPPPATALSLNTHRLPFLSPPADVNSPPAPPPLHSLNRKRGPEDDGGGDRRHERLMKNRESAARSRARKQAYTYELEMKVAHLKQENAKLRRQKEKLSIGVAAAMPSKKNKLYRTLTAPF